MKLLPEVSPVDGALHQQNLLLLSYAQAAPDVATFQLYTRALADTGDVVGMLTDGGSMTKTFIVRNPTISQLIIIICGMNNFGQAALCLQSWSDTAGAGVAFNTYLSAAVSIATNVVNVPAGGFAGVRIIGHSYGGAVALNLPQPLATDIAQGAIQQIYTYGAPKPFNRQQDQGRSQYDIRRCFQNTDPVPSLPLTSQELNSLWVYTGVPTARAWESWIQPVTGLVFDGFGHLLVSSNPTIPASPTVFALSLLSWVTGSAAFGAQVHSLASYVAAASTLVVATSVTTSPATQRIRPPTLTPTNTMQLDKITETAIVATQVAANPVNAAVGIVSGTPLVQGIRYRGVIVNKKPWVYYGTTPIVPCKTKRVRRALVRRLNRTII